MCHSFIIIIWHSCHVGMLKSTSWIYFITSWSISAHSSSLAWISSFKPTTNTTAAPSRKCTLSFRVSTTPRLRSLFPFWVLGIGRVIKITFITLFTTSAFYEKLARRLFTSKWFFHSSKLFSSFHNLFCLYIN